MYTVVLASIIISVGLPRWERLSTAVQPTTIIKVACFKGTLF